MAKGKITSETDLKIAKVFDFLTFTYGGDVEEGDELWFRVEGPGTSGTSRVGVAQEGQFQVQQNGDFEVAFTDGEKDLATKKFTIEAPDEE
jgi:hypothetical protein